MRSTKGEYIPIVDSENASSTASKKNRYGTCAWVANVVLFCFSLAVLTTNLNSIRSRSIVTDWSASDYKDFARQDSKFAGSFRSSSPYRGPPGPEVDGAWARYTDSPWIDGTAVVLGVDREEIGHAHKDSEAEWYNTTVDLGASNGGNTMATLEMFHQLHCLNLLRKFTHFDYYRSTGGVFDTPPDIQRNHIDHCIEIIRQVIMCNGDTGLIVFHWVKDHPNPYPDFNTWHSCRDPEQILSLAREKAAPIRHRIRKPEGMAEMPTPP